MAQGAAQSSTLNGDSNLKLTCLKFAGLDLANVELLLIDFELARDVFEMSFHWSEMNLRGISCLIPSAFGGNMNIEAGPGWAGAGHRVAVVDLKLNGLEVILRGIPHLILSTLSGEINAPNNFKLPSNFDLAGPESAGLEPACAGHGTTCASLKLLDKISRKKIASLQLVNFEISKITDLEFDIFETNGRRSQAALREHPFTYILLQSSAARLVCLQSVWKPEQQSTTVIVDFMQQFAPLEPAPLEQFVPFGRHIYGTIGTGGHDVGPMIGQVDQPIFGQVGQRGTGSAE